MKRTWIICFFLISLPFAAVFEVRASDLRCGSALISIGNYKYDVLRKCGEPTHVEVWEEVRIKRNFLRPRLIDRPEVELFHQPLLVKEYVKIEEWEYNLGPQRFIRYLRFENGRLRNIATGDYGY